MAVGARSARSLPSFDTEAADDVTFPIAHGQRISSRHLLVAQDAGTLSLLSSVASSLR